MSIVSERAAAPALPKAPSPTTQGLGLVNGASPA